MAFRGFGLGLGRRLKRALGAPPWSQSPALIPPDHMIAEHSGGIDRATYLAMGEEIVRHTFIERGGLQPHHRILDVGCGCAKVARPLLDYLSPRGAYHGIDIGKDCIDWCRAAYRDFRNFHFHHADLFSTRYRQEGASPAATYRFPLEDDTFDLVFLGSVFTHLLPDEVENYLREIRRVLRPGGRVVATYFLLDDVARANVEAGRTTPDFRFRLPGPAGCRVVDPAVPEAAIAYEEDFLRDAYPRSGLELTDIGHGHWGRGRLVPHWQDEVWGRKPSAAGA